MKCLDCGCDEGTLLKEFDNAKNYSWFELSEMTEVCASCGSENIKIEKIDDKLKGNITMYGALIENNKNER